MQRSATIDRTLVAGAGKRFESARRLSLFGIGKPNTLFDRGPAAHGRGPPDTTEVVLERHYPSAVHAMGCSSLSVVQGPAAGPSAGRFQLVPIQPAGYVLVVNTVADRATVLARSRVAAARRGRNRPLSVTFWVQRVQSPDAI